MLQRSVRVLTAVVLLVSLSFIATPSSANLADDIETLKREQGKVREEKSAKAKSVDTATAEVAELAEALKALNDQVNAQQAKIDAAENLSQQTEERGAAALAQSVAMEARISDLEGEVSELAVTGFQNRNQQSDLQVLTATSPTEAATMSRLSKTAARSEIEAVEELRQSKADLEFFG